MTDCMEAQRTSRPFAVDLFAGAGGLTLGFEEAGFDVAASVEYDPVHAAVHSFNFPNSAMFCCDIRQLVGDEVRLGSRIGAAEVEVVFGGPPCQGISLIGKRDVKDPRNELLGEFARIVSEIMPRYFVMENVAGLLVGGHKALLDGVILKLEKSGYAVQAPKVLQAAEYGVPQSRQRLFLIGSRLDVDLPFFPDPLCSSRKTSGPSAGAVLPLGPSVDDALRDLPDIDLYDELLTGDKAFVEYGEASEYGKKLRDPSCDNECFAAPRIFDKRQLTSSMRTRHTEKTIKRFEQTLPGRVEPVSRFLRLHPDGISNTLRAGTGSERGAYTAPRPIHPIYPRVISVREAARLHGYPDWFRFHVTKWNGFREVGNSVPVPLGRAVASCIMRADSLIPSVGDQISLGNEDLLAFSQSEAVAYFGLDHGVIPQRERRK